MDSNFYSKEEISNMGFKFLGENVFISKKASIYGAKNIHIGDNVRIDDFCILSGKIEIGNYVHIAAYCSFYGGHEGIYIGDFSTTSSRCAIYALSDDYSGNTLTNPMIPDEYKNVQHKRVIIGKHCIVGTNSTLLPGVILNDGVSIGAHSLIKTECDEWSLYVGVPANKIKERSKKLLNIEKKFKRILKERE